MFKFIVAFCFLLLSLAASAQDSRLANQYYQNGEYEKASIIYKQLYDKSPASDYYFNKYMECLIAVGDFDAAEKEIKSQIKAKPKEVQLYVSYGNLWEQQFQQEKADKEFQRAIDNLPPDVGIISKLGNSFNRLTKYDYAIKVYEKGGKLLKNEDLFAYNLGNLYLRKGDINKMIYYHLNASNTNPNRVQNLKATFQNTLKTQGALDTLKIQLYERIQDSPENSLYPELLAWVFIQQKDYDKALRQVRFLDREFEENGVRIYNLAEIASNDKDYDTAIKAYQTIINDKGRQSSYYVNSNRFLLQAKKDKLLSNFDYTSADLDSLRAEYSSFIEEFGVNNQTAIIAKEFAEFKAIYLNDLDGAIEMLNTIISFKTIDRNTIAESKIGLADYYLMQDEVWESTLLYSQVDKDFNEEFLGELARFKNAKLSYYNGDFQWAQEQFDILKRATSRLISNDAIDLSVLIMDNLNLDTVDIPLLMYAQADLLAFQNKFDQAFQKLDSITTVYPEHTLEDDVLYSKAKLYIKLKDYDKAIEAYNSIISDFPEEIRCDNAIFELAELYELRLDQKDKAKDLYEKLFIDFSNSTFAIEARKRYRILRGDNVQ